MQLDELTPRCDALLDILPVGVDADEKSACTSKDRGVYITPCLPLVHFHQNLLSFYHLLGCGMQARFGRGVSYGYIRTAIDPSTI